MNKKRVLMDMNMTARWCRGGVMVGIVRVSVELFRSLGKITDVYMVQLVPVEGKSEPEIHVIDPETWELTDQILLPSADDLYLMSEIQIRGVHVAMDYPWPGYLARYGVERCAIIHDILPVEMPQFFEKETALRMPEYILGLFRNYNQVICVSNAVLDSVTSFLEKGEIAPYRMDLEMVGNDLFYAYMRSGWHLQDHLAFSGESTVIGFNIAVPSSVVLQFFLAEVSGSFRVLANGYDLGVITASGRRAESFLLPTEILSSEGYQEITLVADSNEPGCVVLSGLSIFSAASDPVPVRSLVSSPLSLSFVHEGVNPGKSAAPVQADEAFDCFFAPSGDGKIFLMVGTIEPRKGHALVLDTFEQLWAQGSNDKLCIVGKPGWNMDTFMLRLRTHPEAGNRLLLLDHASDAVLQEAYRRSDALIQASAGEGFGLPLIEAGQHGKPVLCSDIPVFHEVGGDHALYFPRTVEGLSRCISFFDDHCGTDRIPDSRKITKRSWDDFAGDCYRLMTGQSSWVLSSKPEVTPVPARKKVLVALTYSVYPPKNGGQSRVFGLYKNLARNYDVELVCMAPHSAKRTRKLIAPHLVENVVPMSQENEIKGADFESKSSASSADMSVLLFGDKTPEYAETLRTLGRDAEWIVSCHPYPWPFIKAVLPDKKVMYEAQDVEYVIKKGMYQSNPDTESALSRLFDAEKECCLNSLITMVCSEADKQKLIELYGADPSRLVVIANGVNTDEIEYVDVPERLALKKKYGLSAVKVGIFMGAWHEPNLLACKALIREAGNITDAKIFLLGSQCQYFEGQSLPENVGLMGFVSPEEKRRIFSLVDFALNPVMSGSGTNVKMFDYFAAGIPIISTSFGTRGIDRKDLMIIAENEDLGRAIHDFDLSSCEAMVAEGRRYVEETFDYKVIADVLETEMRKYE